MRAWNDLMVQLRDPSVTRARVDWVSLVRSLPGNLPCTRHPLGFLHIELTSLVSIETGERLRLHYWPSLGANADEIGSLHDHIWSLASAVAAGHLRDTTYQPVPTSAGAFSGTRVFYEAGHNRFSSDGSFDLSLLRRLEIGPGTIYRVPSRVVHNTEIVDAPAVTIVLARDDSEASELGPLILQPRGREGSGTAVREPYDCDAALSLVLKRLTRTD